MSNHVAEATHVFTDLYRAYLPEPHASLLSGMVFGEKLRVSEAFQHAIKITGLLHMVVLSGTNITLLGAFASVLTRGLGKKVSAYISIVVIALFVVFVGVDPPVTRAALMGILTLVAVVYERKTLGLYLLFMSSLLMLLVKPEWLTSVSFQLSCGATFGIMMWGGTSRNRDDESNLPPANRIGSMWKACRSYIVGELRPSLAAQVLTTPIIFWYFREVSLIAPLANLAVSFAVSPIMVFGLLSALLGYIHPVLGYVPALLCYVLLEYVITIINLMAQIPYIFHSFSGT